MFGFLGKIKKVLTVITDFLLIGRNAGWWDKNNGPDPGGPTKNTPGQ
jgi:hypothetical protein